MNRPPQSDVLVIEAEPVLRHGLVSLFNSHPKLRIVGEAETVRSGREYCEKLKPDIVVINPALDGGEGFVLLKDMPRWAAQARTVAFSAMEDPESVKRAFAAGACGYVARRDPVSEVIAAVLSAAEGERRVGPAIEKVLLAHLAAGMKQADTGAAAQLSSREWQVFRLIGEGRAIREIAEMLGIDVQTVASHQQRIKKKLGLRSGAELRKRAVASLLQGEGS